MRLTRTPLLKCVLCLAVLGSWASAASATPISFTPYLGVTITKDSLSLPAPVDQTPGSNLGAHTANVHVVQIDLTAPGLGFKVSPDNGALPLETRTQTTLQYLTQQNAQLR